MPDSFTAYRTCPLCEATCGLEITIEAGEVSGIRGDAEDVFSHGFICPKGPPCKALHEDPDRVRTPLVRTGSGFEPVSWDEAFAEIDRRLTPILRAGRPRRGRRPTSATPTPTTSMRSSTGGCCLKALGTKNIFSASTVDQMPKHVSAGLMFGTMITIPVPDVDRTDYLLMLGRQPARVQRQPADGARHARPAARDPGARRPRRGRRPAPQPHGRGRRRAPLHPARHGRALPVRAGQRALRRGAGRRRASWPSICQGLDEVERAGRRFTPEAVADACGIEAGEIRRMARELAAAERAAVYGRIGTCTQEFGTLASWLVDVLNVVDRQPRPPGRRDVHAPAAGAPNTRGAPGQRQGRQDSAAGRAACARRRRSSESCPCACLAEEIDTPGRGPDASALHDRRQPGASARPTPAACAGRSRALELMVSVDIYVNETTRHADVILPAPSALCRSHYDLALYQLAARNVANYSPPVLDLDSSMPGRVADAAAADRDRRRARAPTPTSTRSTTSSPAALVQRELQDPASPLSGRSAARADVGARSRGAAPSGCSTGCCGRDPTATASAPTPTA